MGARSKPSAAEAAEPGIQSDVAIVQRVSGAIACSYASDLY